MKLPHKKIERLGFTLIEMLVVIVIIGLLASLIAAAAAKALEAAHRTRNRTEIGQIEVAIEAFKVKYNVDYIPSMILLSETGNYSASNNPKDSLFMAALRADSGAYLGRIWPKLNYNNAAGGIDWNGNGVIDPPPLKANIPALQGASGDMILEGDQCLAFFLGGIPQGQPLSGTGSPAATTGFSTHGDNPAFHTMPTLWTPANPGPGEVNPPFFDFNSNRLAVLSDVEGTGRSQMMFSYLDTYGAANGLGTYLSGSPYAYFSSYKTQGGYNRYAAWGTLSNSSPFNPVTGTFGHVPGVPDNYQLGLSDCPTLLVWPYMQTAPAGPAANLPLNSKYQKPIGYQIISAGGTGTYNALTGGWGFGTGSAIYYNQVAPKGWTTVIATVDGSGNLTFLQPGTWIGAQASSIYPQSTDGYDDQANFAASPLGYSQ